MTLAELIAGILLLDLDLNMKVVPTHTDLVTKEDRDTHYALNLLMEMVAERGQNS